VWERRHSSEYYYRAGSLSAAPTAEESTMKMPVLLLLAWLAQKSGQALNLTTLSLIAAFTEQARATSSVLFFCWSPAGKTYRTFLISYSWARQLSRMSQLMQGFIAQSCCAHGDSKLRCAVLYWCCLKQENRVKCSCKTSGWKFCTVQEMSDSSMEWSP